MTYLIAKKNIIIFFILILCSAVQSQTLSGYINNSKKEPLTGVNIYLRDSNMGTISNREGYYKIILPGGRQEVIFSYIGFKNDTVEVHLLKDETQALNVILEEYLLESSAIYAFAKQYNDAQEIVYKTIENKRAYLSSINNYEYDAYHKTVIRADKKQQRLIGGLIETKSRGYYENPDKFQEVVLAKRQSKNFSELTNVLSVGRVPNLLEESLTFDELRVLSPLSNKALDYYEYEMTDTTFYNKRMVFNMTFKPKLKSLPLFTGTMSIIDKDFAVISCELFGGESIKTVIRDQIHIVQNFRQFGGKYWFPVEMNMNSRISIDIPAMPYLYWKQHVLISNYSVNQPEFKHHFDETQLSYQISSDKKSREIWSNEQTIPLNSEEEAALRHIDSTVTNAGILVRSAIWAMANFDKILITGFYDFYHYNRVQGSYLGIGFDSRRTWRDRRFWLRTGYGLADEKFVYDLQIQKLWFDERLLTQMRILKRLDFVDRFYRYNPTDITSQTLLGKNDYADYLYRDGGEVTVEYRLRHDLRFGLNYEWSRQEEAQNNKHWSRPEPVRAPFPVEKGKYSTLEFNFGLDNLKYFDFGWLVAPDMSQDFYDLQLRYLLSSKEYLNSYADFERLYLYFSIFQRVPPLINFYFRLNAGKLFGNVPLQYYFHLAGAYGSFGNPVLFRTVTSDQFLGDRFLIIALENNFKNTIFNFLRIPFLKYSKLDLLVFSNIGWMHTPEMDGAYNPVIIKKEPLTELGVSVGNIFTFLRLDLTWRLNYKTGNDFRINLTSRLFIR